MDESVYKSSSSPNLEPDLEPAEYDFMVGEEFKIAIIGPKKSGKTSFVNKLVRYQLYKHSLLSATTSVIRTHCWRQEGIEIVNNSKRTSHKKSFPSRKELQDFLDSHSDEIQLSFSVDVYIRSESAQMGCVFIEIPDSTINKDWEPDFSPDVLIVFAGITDGLITQPETMKCMLSEYHDKLVRLDTTQTYFVTNKCDTLDEEDTAVPERDEIERRFKSSVKSVWPVPVNDDKIFCISLHMPSKFSKGLDALVEDVEKTAWAYFHFRADDAIEKIISLVQQLLKLLRMKEFPSHIKQALLNSSPKLLDNLETKRRELQTIEWAIVVAGDTSAGKTTLINRLVGHRILVPRTLASTAVVCRIRKSEKIQIELYTKENELLERRAYKNVSSLHDDLRTYTELDKKTKINDKNIYFVDISLPSEALHNRTVLVDTPGIGHDETLDGVLLDYLPYASSFIFLVDAANAGGVQKDRLMKIMRVVVEKQDAMPYFNLKDVLFLTNKWDSVENDSDSSDDEAEEGGRPDQKTRMYDFIIGTLSREWPSVSKDTVFQVCLKKDESEYQSEFKRFQTKFMEVLEKNKSLRICDDFRFVWEAFTNIEKVVFAIFAMQGKGEKQRSVNIKEGRNLFSEFKTMCSEIWIFGMVERESNTLIIYPVGDRTEGTLLPIIERHVERGSTIYSDGWSSYFSLNDRGYDHFTVVHKYAFKKTYINTRTQEEVDVHTNRIEGAWKHAKDHFKRMSGTKITQFEGHLAEIMWRSEVKSDLYPSFFNLMKSIFPLDKPACYQYTTPLFDTWACLPDSQISDWDIRPGNTDAESQSDVDTLSEGGTSNDFNIVSDSDNDIPRNRTASDNTLRLRNQQQGSSLDSVDRLLMDSDPDKTLTNTMSSPTVSEAGPSSRKSSRVSRKKGSTQRKRKEGVCHPKSFAEKDPVPAARKRKASNPYSKSAFVWSDDDDFQL